MPQHPADFAIFRGQRNECEHHLQAGRKNGHRSSQLVEREFVVEETPRAHTYRGHTSDNYERLARREHHIVELDAIRVPVEVFPIVRPQKA